MKRTAIYGTGNLAANKIKELVHSGADPVVVYDRLHFWGEFCGIPIRFWGHVWKEDIDELIICAPDMYVEEIYRRIFDAAFNNNIRILGYGGEDLYEIFGIPDYRLDSYCYSKRSLKDLYAAIDDAEAVSFDIFDTLIMRRTMEPTDVFELVDIDSGKKFHFTDDFRAVRREAELKCGGNIQRIYSEISGMVNVSQSDIRELIEKELKYESLLTVPRRDMVEAFKYALKMGKSVSLISDMYLPHELMKNILEKNGISGDYSLFISCDYGVNKGNGLFQIYKNKINANKYLHIGDDLYADICGAKREGIVTFEIRSSMDLAKYTTLSALTGYARSIVDRLIAGIVMEELFNSPFSLCAHGDIIEVDDARTYGKVFIAPLIFYYMEQLFLYVKQNGSIKTVLFPARDGFLMKKIFDMYYKEHLSAEGRYLFASRRLCNEAADYDNTDVGRNYRKYLKQEGIENEGEYVLCELCSKGSTQDALNRILKTSLKGFYLSRRDGLDNLDIHSLYDRKEHKAGVGLFVEWGNCIESVMSSNDPSCIAIDSTLQPVYDIERRTEKEKIFMEKSQKGILEFFDIMSDCGLIASGEHISDDLCLKLLSMQGNVVLSGELDFLNERGFYDDLLQKRIKYHFDRHIWE